MNVVALIRELPFPTCGGRSLLAKIGFWERPADAFRQALGPPVHAFHGPIDDWLGSLSMSVAMFCAIGLFVVTGVWIWTLRREFIFRGAPSQRWWYDLRIWATLVLLPYIAIYVLFG